MKFTQNAFLQVTQIPQILFWWASLPKAHWHTPAGFSLLLHSLCYWQISKNTPGPLHSLLPCMGEASCFSHRPTGTLLPHTSYSQLMPHSPHRPQALNTFPCPIISFFLFLFLFLSYTLWTLCTPGIFVSPISFSPDLCVSLALFLTFPVRLTVFKVKLARKVAQF